MKIYLNGEFVEKEDAKISVFDHGLLYGDGVFEGIRLYDGCVYKLDEHLERLEHSAKAILLEMPMSREKFAEAVCETCRQNNLKNGYIRLIVTRGPGHLGLTPDGCGPQSVPLRIINTLSPVHSAISPLSLSINASRYPTLLASILASILFK